MRIAVYHNQPSGGARRALFGFCRELHRRHDVDVYSLSTADQELLRDKDIGTGVVRFAYRPRRPIRMGLWLNDLQLERDLHDLDRLNARIAAAIDAAGYDVVLVDACRFTYAPHVLRHLSTPSAYYCHHGPWRVSGGLNAPTGAYDSLRRVWHLPLERRRQRNLLESDIAMTRKADRVITNSNYSRSCIARHYGIDAVVCPPGADVPRREQWAREGYIVSVGALETHKGHDFLIRALATLPSAERPEIHIVANDANATVRRRLESLASQVQVRLVIKFRIPDDELHGELSRAALFVFGAHYEPLGLGSLEAMAHRLPVVAVAEGGVIEAVKHGVSGFLCARDEADFGQRVLQLLRSPALRHDMGESGLKAVEQSWTWAERGAVLEGELIRLAGAKTRGLPAA
ncbi:MAG TPA: glycosyltransferase family 4 protein [Candidatus Dormibacteraeota bacterium]|nr:glycosyltransferase family 4 protein [Candidatus Dormibacteraeota bacterium]HEX2681131.1 glycosyltransferase family 4 protein [Candidatus Dormibacteraeota bacterium]